MADKDPIWIEIGDPKHAEKPWIGRIIPPQLPGQSWRFELVRRADELRFFDHLAVEWNGSKVGLLDLQHPCTLLGVRVVNTKPGVLGANIGATRTVIEGEFDDLVSNLALEDLAAPVVRRLVFASEALTAWLCRHDARSAFSGQILTIELEPDFLQSHLLPDGRQLEVRAGTVVSKRPRDSTLRATATLGIKFPSPVSVLEARKTAMVFQILLAFLTGFREPPPDVGLEAEVNGEAVNAELIRSGLEWSQADAPHSGQCLTTSEDFGVSLEGAATAIIDDFDSLFERMNVVLFAAQGSKNLNDRFAAVVPILEAYLIRRFSEVEELSYRDQEAAFFEWIDRSDNPNILAFSRKHIKTVNRKAASLRLLLERAMKHLNVRGFNFPLSLSNRIQLRRSAMFHATIKIAPDEGPRLYEEERAATAMLMFLTLEDLGGNITKLAADSHRLGQFRIFGTGTRPAPTK